MNSGTLLSGALSGKQKFEAPPRETLASFSDKSAAIGKAGGIREVHERSPEQFSRDTCLP